MMGSKNKSQYASLPNLSNQDLICQKMRTRTAISNTSINNFALRRENGISLYEDHESNTFNEKIQKGSNTEDYIDMYSSIWKKYFTQLEARPTTECRDSLNSPITIHKKESRKHNSDIHNPYFKTQCTIQGMKSCLNQTKTIKACNGRINWILRLSKLNSGMLIFIVLNMMSNLICMLSYFRYRYR